MSLFLKAKCWRKCRLGIKPERREYSLLLKFTMIHNPIEVYMFYYIQLLCSGQKNNAVVAPQLPLVPVFALDMQAGRGRRGGAGRGRSAKGLELQC